MLRKFFVLSCGVLLLACGENKTEPAATAETVAKDSVITVDSVSTAFDYSNTRFENDFADTLLHVFSDPAKPDRFTLFVPKGNIYETKSVLKIETADGRLIYEDTFETFGLISGYDVQANVHNETEMQAYLQRKKEDFLHNNAFVDLNPVKDDLLIQRTTGDEKGSEFEDYESYLLAQKEKSPLFVYGLFEESISYIGYSPKLKKAVLVTACC